MVAQLIDGKKIAQTVKCQIELDIKQRCAAGLQAPGLAVILVGDDPASAIYVNKKHEACQAIGLYSEIHRLSSQTTELELLKLIKQLNDNTKIHGILVQLPLPKQIDANNIIDAIDPRKDVDGFHPYNMGRLAQRHPALRPCTPYGIITMLEHLKLNVRGLDAVIVGASNIVGRPMALELLLAGCTVTVCHRFTQNLQQKVENAQLLVVAIGKPGIIQTAWLQPGTIVIDVGMNRLPDGRICGDIEFESAREKVAWLTPVPGGVGPMTVAMLMQNTLQAAINLDE